MKQVALLFLLFYVFFAEIYLGSLVILCFRILVPNRWLEPLVPNFVKMQQLAYILVPSFLFLQFFVPILYPWTAATNSLGAFHAQYLHPSAFFLRGLFFWLLWILLSRSAQKKQTIAGAGGLLLLLFTATLASFDWVMSIDLFFSSTIFGLIFLVSAAMLALSVAFLQKNRGAEKLQADQATVLFALVCTWTYLNFMQLIIVWSGNLPSEVEWYFIRKNLGWGLLPILFAFLQFFLPFLLLLQKPLKRSQTFTTSIATLTIFMQFLFVAWQILPAAIASLLRATPLLLVALFLLFLFFQFFPQAEGEKV